MEATSAGGPALPLVVFTALALLIGPGFAWLGATNLRLELAVQRRAVRLPGEVAGAEWHRVGRGRPSRLSFPVVRCAEPAGSVRTFLADVGNSIVTRTGTQVEVLHDPTGATPPQLAGLRSRAVVPAGFLVLGTVFSLVGVGLLLALL